MTSSPAAPSIRREIGDDGICVLIFDRPESGANIFDAATLDALRDHLDFIEKESGIKGVLVTSAKKSIFIAGADLQTLLRQAEAGSGMREFIAEGQQVFNRFAGLKIPTVAAINGASAGGGYEVALACDYRIASDSPATRIGLPETSLGLVPAWGGATRLPRLIGPEKASEVILKGKLYSAKEALQLGLVDEVVPQDQLLSTAKAKLNAGKPAKNRPAGSSPAEPGKTPDFRSQNPALGRAVEIINQSLTSSTEESLARELDAIVELGETESTRNLIRNFFLADKYKKGTSNSPNEKFTHAAVIGAGVMGSGIAQWLSSRGISVILRDVSPEQLDRGLGNIEKTYGEAVKRGLMTEEKAQEGRARIVASGDPGPMRDVQIVIEAASEKLEVKKAIFHNIDSKIDDTDILATNTSALSISTLAAETQHPSRVIGLHFFNPVSRMKLIEVVMGKETSEETKARSLAFARQIGKIPVVVQDSPGFLVNRVLFPYLLDAAELFEQGLEAKKIDAALVEWGMPMGPLRLMDEIGVDITVDIAATLEKTLGARGATPAILPKMREAGLLGRKSGSGFYQYQGREQSPNEALEGWRQKSAPEKSAEDLVLRLVYLMVNEAACCLEEKVVSSPEDADYGMMLGTGFAPLRGGPLRFADHFGIARMVEAGNRHGGKFRPCDLLQKHASDGTKFYDN